ncbi:putative ribosomal protein S9 [Helianthus annuus]|nr:putative ribosomal protein S9 [Helianthus annuus]
MAIALSSLTSSFSSLSFSSQISPKPFSLSLTPSLKSTNSSQFPKSKPSSLTVVATVAAEPLTADLETLSLEKYVKSRLPGGFAAQTLIGTGRRKCAIARVVIQEGTGKFIINYRDAKEGTGNVLCCYVGKSARGAEA